MLTPVILAGGFGTRLWPLSHKELPKQFMKLGSDKTLFQETLLRICHLQNITSPIVVCSHKHKALILKQLLEIGVDKAFLILEPCGRNTAPAVTLAAILSLHLFAETNLLVLPADHMISDIVSLHNSIFSAKKHASCGNLVCFGVDPLRPETGYGYVKIGQKIDQSATDVCAFRVERFVEKPHRELAENYLQSKQYLWNGGIFMFSASSYLGEMRKFAPDIFATCQKIFQDAKMDDGVLYLGEEFAACRSDSIDYAIMEKTDKAVVVQLNAGWSDAGSWNALWEYHKKDDSGNVVFGDVALEKAKNCYVHATKRKVVVFGVENHIIIETPDAVLVIDKRQEQDIKKMIENLS